MMDQPPANWRIDETIPSRVEDALAMVRRIIEFLKRQAWPQQDVFAVHMAFEETLMNAIKHGNANDQSKRVHVLVAVWDNRIYARITDEGSGFDPEAVADPCLQPNLDKTTGRGLILISNFVDELEYIEPGNCVEFQKYRSTGEGSRIAVADQQRETAWPLSRRIKRRISSTLIVASTRVIGNPVRATMASISVGCTSIACRTVDSCSFRFNSAG